MTKLANSIEIEASPEKVWAFGQNVEKMNEAMKGMAELEQTSKGPVGVGTTYHFIGKAGGQTTETDMELTEFVPNKKIAYHSIGTSKVKMAFSWIFEPTAKGTKVSIDTDYEVPYSILGKLVDKLRIHKDMEKNNDKMLANIKKAVEAE
jgi:carbon monoxide dehydrogenase subunit G